MNIHVTALARNQHKRKDKILSRNVEGHLSFELKARLPATRHSSLFYHLKMGYLRVFPSALLKMDGNTCDVRGSVAVTFRRAGHGHTR